jgi:hypothetical protein
MVEENRLLVEYFPKIGPISGICYKLFSKRGKILLKKIFEYKNGIINLCSTVIGSFFQDFVKIFNKIRAEVGS